MWPEGRGEEIKGGKGEVLAGTSIKDTWTITRGGENRGKRWGELGWWRGLGCGEQWGERQITVLEQ